MKRESTETIRAEIARANSLAEAGSYASAVQSFALARTMAVDLAEPADIDRAVQADDGGYVREREALRRIIAGRESSGDPIVIFGDSLALPRAAEKTGALQGCDLTYPWMLADALESRPIDSFGQRYLTTDDIVTYLTADPTLGSGADVVIHVGLNDCPNRMFLKRERLAMGLLPEDVRTGIVGFAQKYRRRIIALLPAQHYVPIDRFRANLDHIAMTLRARKARRIVFTTIILPPVRFWPGTPGMNGNFAAYNLQIMEAVARHGALLLDIDRHVWQDLASGPLQDDGMHLSTVGHRLFAAKAAQLLAQPGK